MKSFVFFDQEQILMENMATPRKAKKARTTALRETADTTASAALGLKSTRTRQKEDAELELEEAVFGRSRIGRASLWNDDSTPAVTTTLGHDIPDEEDVETGLERMRDENVSCLLRRSFLHEVHPLVLQARAGLTVAGYRSS